VLVTTVAVGVAFKALIGASASVAWAHILLGTVVRIRAFSQ
jgi:hypothetical protein